MRKCENLDCIFSGLIERFNSTVTNCLKTSIDQQKDWVDCLQSIAMAYRAGVHASTGKNPYEVMFGLRMRMPVHLLTHPYDDVDGDAESDEEVQIEEDTRPYEEIFSELENVRQLIHQSCAANISTSQARQAKDYDARHRGAPLQVGDLIMNYNTKAKQRKGDRMALNWTGPYQIIKVHKNGNYSVTNSKGKALTTKMCASNVKLWQEPMDWDAEPAPDWINAQLLDTSEPTVDAASVKKKKSAKPSRRETTPETWIPPPSQVDDSSSDSEYEGEPPVKRAQYPEPLSRVSSKRKKTSEIESTPPKKSAFHPRTSHREHSPSFIWWHRQAENCTECEGQKKRTLSEQREQRTALRQKEKVRKDEFFNQMMKVNELPDLTPSPSLHVDTSDTDDVTILGSQPAGDDFMFLPLVYANRQAVCERVSLIMRKTNIPHSQIGEKLSTREPRVTKIKGDGNCLFRALCLAITGWETGHLKIRQLVCDHIHESRALQQQRFI